MILVQLEYLLESAVAFNSKFESCTRNYIRQAMGGFDGIQRYTRYGLSLNSVTLCYYVLRSAQTQALAALWKG